MESISNWTNSFHESFSKKNINLTQIEIWKFIFDRKKNGMDKLKSWDESSKANIQMIKMLLDSMFLALEKNLNESFNRYEKVYRFFSQIKLTFQAKTKFTPDLPLFKFESAGKNDDISEPNASSFYDFVETFENNLNQFQEKVNSFKTEIHQNINQKILSEKVKQKENSIKILFTDVRNLKAKLQKLSLLTSNKLSNLMKAFKEYFVDGNKIKRPTINIFEFVFSFINHVKDLSEMIRNYGSLFVRLYDESKDLERERLEAMSESFSFFFKLTRTNFCGSLVESLSPSIDRLGLIDHSKLIDNAYDVSKLLQPDEKDLIKSTVGCEANEITTISKFIKSSKYEESSKDIFEYFVLKIYKAEEINQKSGKTREIVLFLTIDYFYTVYTVNEETREYELVSRFAIEETELTFSDQSITNFIYYERNFLWKSKKKYSFKFLVDCQEEIMLDHEAFSLLLKPEIPDDDSASTKILNKSLDDARDFDSRGNSPENSSDKVLNEDCKIEVSIEKIMNNGQTKNQPILARIDEEKDEERFTDERSLDVDSKNSNDELNLSRKRLTKKVFVGNR